MLGRIFTLVTWEKEGSEFYIGEEVRFFLPNRDHFKLFHWQECCERVEIVDLCGDLTDLAGAPLLVADESSHFGEGPDGDGIRGWTYYKFATIKGCVTIRWEGESNGYYGIEVDLQYISEWLQSLDWFTLGYLRWAFGGENKAAAALLHNIAVEDAARIVGELAGLAEGIPTGVPKWKHSSFPEQLFKARRKLAEGKKVFCPAGESGSAWVAQTAHRLGPEPGVRKVK